MLKEEIKTEEFIKKSKLLYGETKFIFNRTHYKDNRTPVEIFCTDCQEYYWQRPSLFLKGNGCKLENIKNYNKDKRLTTDIFIEKANLVHNFKYDYSLSVYINAITPVIIICHEIDEETGLEHGEFMQTPNVHTNKNRHTGCPKCGEIRKISKKQLTQDQFLNRSNNIHGMNRYDYSESIYKGLYISIAIICHKRDKNNVEHGKFIQTPASHFAKGGCPICANESRSKNHRKSSSELINRANIKYNFKYDYSLAKPIDTRTKVIIICHEIDKKTGLEHGEFLQNFHIHLKKGGVGCPKCVRERIINSRKTDKEEIINRAIEAHGKDRYDYSLSIYVNYNTKVEIICNKCGKHFWQTPSNHINKTNPKGCPHCRKSKGEEKISKWLESVKINYDIEKSFNDCKNKKVLFFDFYLPDYNFCIEYDGEQHYKIKKFFGGEKDFSKTKKRDQIKTDYCLKNNIKLLRIPYWDFNNIETILKENITI